MITCVCRGPWQWVVDACRDNVTGIDPSGSQCLSCEWNIGINLARVISGLQMDDCDSQQLLTSVLLNLTRLATTPSSWMTSRLTEDSDDLLVLDDLETHRGWRRPPRLG